ncbi:hypothetical protein K438DRAFT_1775283 [Mycena galopus ATCC 62051]|nr:hypothetical protein K438DRAFT_1775283 [Mycena galopus ATCC 62051]
MPPDSRIAWRFHQVAGDSLLAYIHGRGVLRIASCPKQGENPPSLLAQEKGSSTGLHKVQFQAIKGPGRVGSSPSGKSNNETTRQSHNQRNSSRLSDLIFCLKRKRVLVPVEDEEARDSTGESACVETLRRGRMLRSKEIAGVEMLKWRWGVTSRRPQRHRTSPADEGVWAGEDVLEDALQSSSD